MTICNCAIESNQYKHSCFTDIHENSLCVDDDREMLIKMADRFNLEHNIIFLQAILERISDECEICGELVKECRRYAENKSSVLYFKKKETPPGTPPGI